jgi:hypothetical protein
MTTVEQLVKYELVGVIEEPAKKKKKNNRPSTSFFHHKSHMNRGLRSNPGCLDVKATNCLSYGTT